MNDEEYVTEYANGLGRTRWQPKLPTGESLHRGIHPPIEVWSIVVNGDEVLYRSRSRAVRVAKREERRRLKNSWSKAK